MAYSLTPGYRIPALQRGLSPTEAVLTKLNLGAGGTALLSGLVTPPPAWSFVAVGATAAVLNLSPGPRSVARWASVGLRRWREPTAPGRMTSQAGTTETWQLYPAHGTMHDPARRVPFHAAVARALTFAGEQARSEGLQIHIGHHATGGRVRQHTQTVTVFIPKGLVARPERVMATLKGEFAALGYLADAEPAPGPEVIERGPGWVALEDGRYACTARITGWPEATDGDLMNDLLLGSEAPARERDAWPERSLAVLYRPLNAKASRRSEQIRDALREAFLTDKIRQEREAETSEDRRGALADGATLVDLDAYLTVWGASPEQVAEARSATELLADRSRVRLDWLFGQQHRAHVMTTPQAASTKKGAIL